MVSHYHACSTCVWHSIVAIDARAHTHTHTHTVHGLAYVSVLVYVYYFGMMDHSGIKMTSWFPWQPDTMFHDDHHKYEYVCKFCAEAVFEIFIKYSGV